MRRFLLLFLSALFFCHAHALSAAPEYKFTITTKSDTTSFMFRTSASGTFYIDWGDGNTEIVEETGNSSSPHSHDYSTAGQYTIRIGGLATGYGRDYASISFSGNSAIDSIDGSLGAIFPTLADGSQPRFSSTFSNTTITSIPENLFAGVTGAAEHMFSGTFYGCSSLTSIPEKLFAGVTGAAEHMFSGTFRDCSALTSIPEKLFAGVTGAAEGMFERTFYNCFALTSIPENLFTGVTGAAKYMFNGTFNNCFALTSIPEKLFAGVTGAANNMFWYTFNYTTITSIPENLFAGVTGAADYMFAGTFSECYKLTSIPENLFAGVTGAAESMFESTFEETAITSIPANLFSGITGNALNMFKQTFRFCSRLTGPSARINGKYLYNLWPDNVADWGRSMYTNSNGLSDYACIPTAMGGGGEECEPFQAPCYIDAGKLMLSTGASFMLYAEKYTHPYLAIKYKDDICYGKLEPGSASGTINLNYNGAVYHLAN